MCFLFLKILNLFNNKNNNRKIFNVYWITEYLKVVSYHSFNAGTVIHSKWQNSDHCILHYIRLLLKYQAQHWALNFKSYMEKLLKGTVKGMEMFRLPKKKKKTEGRNNGGSPCLTCLICSVIVWNYDDTEWRDLWIVLEILALTSLLLSHKQNSGPPAFMSVCLPAAVSCSCHQHQMPLLYQLGPSSCHLLRMLPRLFSYLGDGLYSHPRSGLLHFRRTWL